MTKRIAIIQGHPDAGARHLLHALAEAYGEGARSAGHDVTTIDVASLDFPLLRSQADFETGDVPSSLVAAREAMHAAAHWVFLFPLWHGTMPAMLKGFLEHIFRPGFALEYRENAFPRGLLKGKSARLVVTMGTPVWIFRWYFGGHGLKSFERSMLAFAGVKPVRESLYCLSGADDAKRSSWLSEMREHGRRGD